MLQTNAEDDIKDEQQQQRHKWPKLTLIQCRVSVNYKKKKKQRMRPTQTNPTNTFEIIWVHSIIGNGTWWQRCQNISNISTSLHNHWGRTLTLTETKNESREKKRVNNVDQQCVSITYTHWPTFPVKCKQSHILFSLFRSIKKKVYLSDLSFNGWNNW